MAKIAAADNAAMNKLFASELHKSGFKVASEEDLVAFDDHKKYLDTLEAVLKSDKKESWSPNDMTLD